MDIKLRFVNQSDDGKGAEVVIYQKNMLTSMGALTTAWKVIRYCGRDCYHPFLYSDSYEASITDEYENFSPRVAVKNGQALKLMATPTGARRLLPAGLAHASAEVEVLNSLTHGAVDICLFKNGRLLSRKTTVTPGQKAVFQFVPTLWLTVASQVIQDQPLDSAVLSNNNTELSLLGIASADIVMTGGGSGADATPYAFNLENIVPT